MRGNTMQLTKNFELDEFTDSELAVRNGIDNSPTPEALTNLYQTAAGAERVKTVLGGTPVIISSGYRGPKLNAVAKGSKTSQHMEGEAMDFTSRKFGSPLEICRAIEDEVDFVDFDQLIYEGNWVHISFTENPRHEVLTATFSGGKVKYSKGLPCSGI